MSEPILNNIKEKEEKKKSFSERIILFFGAIKKALTKESILSFGHKIASIASFIYMLTLYLIRMFLMSICESKICPTKIQNVIQPKFESFYDRLIKKNNNKENTLNRINLIEISIRNMAFKKSRTVITVGGMSIGITAIVFLVSLGYGLQDLVTARVARLEEMKQTDVSVNLGSNTPIDDKTLSDISEISEVTHTLPLIASVAKINFNGSVTDTAVFAVTKDYLANSAVKTIEGKLFESNDIAVSYNSGDVSGLKTSRVPVTENEYIQDIDFDIRPEVWVPVREQPFGNSQIIGFLKRTEGILQGEEYWGEKYEDSQTGTISYNGNGEELNPWIKAKVPLWEFTQCTKEEFDCYEGQYKIQWDDDGFQVQKEGYITKEEVVVKTQLNRAQVLGTSTNVLAETTNASESTSSAALTNADWIKLLEEEGKQEESVVTKKNLSSQAEKKAVVNLALLEVLGLTREDAVGKTFEVSFILTGDILGNLDERVESVPTEYEIVGVTPEEDSPFFYVPFIDIRGLGALQYSQLKVVVAEENELPIVREKIESLGYVTSSVVDTVEQINQLFATARTILALIGTVALGVASLGMFNTLTISLLERTREIGLMRAMGMRENEIRELFLTESMIMGFFGGFLGLIMGFLSGQLLSLVLTLIALGKGVGYVDVTTIPFSFVVIIMALSLTVGLITGIYPAKRATQISALNALRYE